MKLNYNYKTYTGAILPNSIVDEYNQMTEELIRCNSEIIKQNRFKLINLYCQEANK